MNYNTFSDICSLIEADGTLLRYVPELQDNKSIVFMAVKENGLALQYASSRLQNDEMIVGVAVKNNGMALQYASDTNKRNAEIVKAALQSNPMAAAYAEDRIITNSVANELVKKNPMVYYTLPIRHKNNYDIAYEAMVRNCNVFFGLPMKFNRDLFFQTICMQKYHNICRILPEHNKFTRTRIV